MASWIRLLAHISNPPASTRFSCKATTSFFGQATFVPYWHAREFRVLLTCSLCAACPHFPPQEDQEEEKRQEVEREWATDLTLLLEAGLQETPVIPSPHRFVPPSTPLWQHRSPHLYPLTLLDAEHVCHPSFST